ncbi:MAG: hypothetical protein AB7K24_27310 [Gemmataceae bacterium]
MSGQNVQDFFQGMDTNTLLDMSQWPVWVLPVLIGGVVLVLFSLYLLTNPRPQSGLQRPVIIEQPVRKDLRSALRRQGNPVDILVSDEQLKSSQQGLVLDRSPRGLCLAISKAFPLNAIITVRQDDRLDQGVCEELPPRWHQL